MSIDSDAERRRAQQVAIGALDYQRFVKAAQKALDDKWCAGMTGTGMVIWFPGYDLSVHTSRMYLLHYDAAHVMDMTTLSRWLLNCQDDAEFWYVQYQGWGGER